MLWPIRNLCWFLQMDSHLQFYSSSVFPKLNISSVLFKTSIKMATSVANSGESGITKDFLEKALGVPVDKFEVKAGSLVGDGYTCVLHSVQVWSGSTSKNIVVKCYPQNPARQGMLEAMDIFNTELCVYKNLVPDIRKFLEDQNVDLKLPFPEMIYGEHWTKQEQKLLGPGRPIESNCIVLPDLRTPDNGSYKLRDRFLGLDLDHYKLVIENQAKLHAISWAYKAKCGISSFAEAYPFFKMDSDEQRANFKNMGAMVTSMFQVAEQICKSNERYSDALTFLRGKYNNVMELYFGIAGLAEVRLTKDSVLRRPEPIEGPEEPWAVLLHGDAWSNNMLFRYDAKTGKPVEVIFIDLQVTRDGDPMADLGYTLLLSTSADLRKKHLTSMLHVYYDTFESVCKQFGVPTLPGFSWEELLRRFRRAKIYGASFAVFALPIMLKNPDELIDMETVATDKTDLDGMTELMEAMQGKQSTNPEIAIRMLGVMEDVTSDEVI